MAERANLMEGLERAIDDRLYSFLDGKGFGMLPPRDFHGSHFRVSLSPKGFNEERSANASDIDPKR
ncbi:hypothetical protein CMI42_06310 [Candidatus Pacearchaeota archaeon]|nr:hypothetical protein [Candidatus Pacearchaeota archaeon]|tara:strand:- start:1045 stop:1242 length:198 start_codon:yes stop_codon:yes gene_type:complete